MCLACIDDKWHALAWSGYGGQLFKNWAVKSSSLYLTLPLGQLSQKPSPYEEQEEVIGKNPYEWQTLA